MRDIAAARERGNMGKASKAAKPAIGPSRASVRLPVSDMAQIRAIAAMAKAGLGSQPKAMLFSGSNAAAAAEAVARQLRRDLFRIDLSAVVSQYIGETEKNLERILNEAGAKEDVILLFDEADALFGKRTNVKDAHDRYSDLEVDFLLNRVVAFDGWVIFVSKPRLTPAKLLQRRISVYDFPPRARR